MEGFSIKIAKLESTMSLYGREVLIAFAIVVFGLILIKWINKGLKRVFIKLPCQRSNRTQHHCRADERRVVKFCRHSNRFGRKARYEVFSHSDPWGHRYGCGVSSAHSVIAF